MNRTNQITEVIIGAAIESIEQSDPVYLNRPTKYAWKGNLI